jgi:hypothetical protein
MPPGTSDEGGRQWATSGEQRRTRCRDTISRVLIDAEIALIVEPFGTGAALIVVAVGRRTTRRRTTRRPVARIGLRLRALVTRVGSRVR